MFAILAARAADGRTREVEPFARPGETAGSFAVRAPSGAKPVARGETIAARETRRVIVRREVRDRARKERDRARETRIEAYGVNWV